MYIVHCKIVIEVMTKYESNIKTLYATVQRVYTKLSDLSNLQTIKDRASDPMFLQTIRQQAGDQVNEEQLAQLQEKLSQLQFTPDSVSIPVEQLGTTLTLHIIEREEPKLIKFELQGSPMPANLWIQLLPCNEGTRMKLTVGVELNFFMRKMVEGKLKTGVEKMADMLAMMPY